MGIKNVFPVETGHSGIDPAWIYIDTEDSTATALTANYLTASKKIYGPIYSNKQMALVSVIDSATTGVIMAEVIVSSDGNVSLQTPINPGNVTLPVVDNDFANFDGTTGKIKDSGYSPTDAAKTKVAMMNAAVLANHIAVYTDTAGTLSDDAAVAINDGDIQAGLDSSAGKFTSFPGTTASGTLNVAAVDSSSDVAVTISNADHAQATVASIPDGGQATTEFIIADSAGTQNITSGSLQIDAGNLTVGSDANAGTITLFPATTISGTLVVAPVDNAGGDFDTTISNASSVGQDQVISIPDSGAATANFLLDTGAANIVAHEEFLGLNEVLRFSVGTWTTTRNAQGDYSSNKAQADETAIIGIDLTKAIRTAASKGFRLDSFDVIYQITTAALDAHSVVLDRVEFANEIAVSVNTIAITGALATTTNANPRVTNVAVDTPAFDNTANSKYVIELTVDAAATSDYAYHGIMLHFSQTVA